MARYRLSLAACASLVMAVALGGCAVEAQSGSGEPGAGALPTAGDAIPSADATGHADYVAPNHPREPAEPAEAHDETVPDACSMSPAGNAAYANPDELRALLVGRWQRCSAPQLPGEDVGVEFTDNHYYPLTRDDSGRVIRLAGDDNEHFWNYVPTEGGYFILDSVQTSLPKISDEPRQLRLLFSPVPSRYVPLE